VKDRASVGARLVLSLVVELVVEDRAYRAIGQGVDLDGGASTRSATNGLIRPTMPRQERNPCSG
jgi:hypothetical protein